MNSSYNDSNLPVANGLDRHAGINGYARRAPGPSAAEAKIDFSQIWAAIKDGKWIILFTTLIVTGAMVAYTRTLDPIYAANALVSVDTGGSSATETFIMYGDRRSIANEIGVLQYSIELAERVAIRLDEAAQAMGTDEFFPLLQGKRENDDIWRRQVASRLMRKVQFQQITSLNMIRFVAESTVPEEASNIVNIYSEEYMHFSREKSRASVVAAREFLEDQVEKRQQELQRLENQWEIFAKGNEVVTQGQDGEHVVTTYLALTQRRDESAFTREQESVQLQLLQQTLLDAEPGLERSVLQEREASSLNQDILAIEQRIAELRVESERFYAISPELRGNEAQHEDRYPELAETVRQIQYLSERKGELTNQLVAETLDLGGAQEGGQLGYVANLKARITEKEILLQGIDAQIEALDDRIGTYESRLQSIPRQSIQREQLQRKIDQAAQWHMSFLQQLQQTLVAQESELGYVEVVKKAFVPQVPIRPNVQQNIILGFLLGLGLGVGLAFVRQAVNTQLTKPEDLADHGFRLVGVIPRMDKEIKASFGGQETIEVEGKLLSTRLIAYLDPWSPITENYRLIRTNVRYLDPARPVQVLLVTSPEAADGKSVTSVNIAITMAQAGRRTLLIDADLRRPSCHKLLGSDRTPGLAEILRGEKEFSISDFSTEVPDLSFIPAGDIDVPPAELFGADNMQRFLDNMRQCFDAIVIDSPPVLAVTDAVLLAPQCDATVIVVSAHKTDLRALEVTQETLERVGSPIIGTIINRYDEKKSGSYKYGYGYYHDYGYGRPA